MTVDYLYFGGMGGRVKPRRKIADRAATQASRQRESSFVDRWRGSRLRRAEASTPASILSRSLLENSCRDDDGGDLLRIGDVIERIRFEKHEIGELPFFDAPELIFHPEEARGLRVAVCSASTGVNPAATKRCNSSWRLKPGKIWTPAGVSVPATNGTPALCSIPTTSSSFSINFLRVARIIGPVALRDLFRDRFHVLVLHDPGTVFHTRVFAEITRVDQIATAFPNQRGHCQV